MSCDCENMTTSQPISSFVNDDSNSHLTGFVGIRTERGGEYYSGWHILHMCFENDVRFLSLFSFPDPQCQKGHRMSHFFHNSTFTWKWQLAPCTVSDLVTITSHRWNGIFNFYDVYSSSSNIHRQSFHQYFHQYVVDPCFHRRKWGKAEVGIGGFALWWLWAQCYTWQLTLTPMEKEPSSVQMSICP